MTDYALEFEVVRNKESGPFLEALVGVLDDLKEVSEHLYKLQVFTFLVPCCQQFTDHAEVDLESDEDRVQEASRHHVALSRESGQDGLGDLDSGSVGAIEVFAGRNTPHLGIDIQN